MLKTRPLQLELISSYSFSFFCHLSGHTASPSWNLKHYLFKMRNLWRMTLSCPTFVVLFFTWNWESALVPTHSLQQNPTVAPLTFPQKCRFQVWIWDTDEVDFRNDKDVIRIQSTSTMEEFLRSGLIRTLSNIYVELIYQFVYLFIYHFLSTYIKFIFLTTTFTSIKRIDFASFSFIEIFLR